MKSVSDRQFYNYNIEEDIYNKLCKPDKTTGLDGI